MIGITNKDSSFFSIKSKDIFTPDSLEDKDNVTDLIEKDVISLTVNEEIDQMTKGSVTLYDPNDLYADNLIEGIELDIAWGYKSFGEILRKIKVEKPDKDEIESNADRRGLKAIIMNPQGTGDQTGVNTYTFSFYGNEILAAKKVKKFETGKRKDVIAELFNELNVVIGIINFKQGNDSVTKKTAVRQDSTPFKLLTELSRQWNAFMIVTRNQKGELIGVFIDPERLDQEDIIRKIFNVNGTLRTFQYKQGEFSNVISYTWKRHIGEGVIGDNARITIINGVVNIQRFDAKTETVKTWRLNNDKIKKELETRDSISEKLKLTKQWLQVKDFAQIEKFFDEIENSTAPQGLGYTINLKLRGDPMIAPPLRIKMDKGFPGRLQQQPKALGGKRVKDGVKYYIRKVTHTIDRSGYNMDCEVGDVVAITGGSLVGV